MRLLNIVGAAQEEAKQTTRQLLGYSKERLRRPTAARGSRAVGFSSSYLYFLVLESSWAFCVGMAVCMYLSAIVVCTPVAMLVSLTNTAESYENDFGYGVEENQLKLALRFATTHIVTMGFGSVLPVSDAGAHAPSPRPAAPSRVRSRRLPAPVPCLPALSWSSPPPSQRTPSRPPAGRTPPRPEEENGRGGEGGPPRPLRRLGSGPLPRYRTRSLTPILPPPSSSPPQGTCWQLCSRCLAFW